MKKTIWISIFLVSLFLLLYVGAWFMAPGAYPRAEYYEFDIPEDSLISIIETVKYENPDFILPDSVRMPNGSFTELRDGRRDSADHWYSIYFYYPDKNKILKTWTRPINENSTRFAFAGINSGMTLGNWRKINESFWWWKNQPDIDEFEQRILQKINTELNSNL
ncbi:MAG: hypothetical protein WDZ80_00545 [Candidatus Paceibacterota bacterium]